MQPRFPQAVSHRRRRMLIESSAVPFNPASIAGLTIWYDANDAATIAQTAGNVTQWNDKSGNGNHLTSLVGSRPITGSRTINGKNVLDFDGTKLLSAAGSVFTATGPMTLFSWLQVDTPMAGANTARIVTNRAAGGGFLFGTKDVNSFTFLAEGSTISDFVRRNASDSVYTPAAAVMVASTWDGTGTATGIHLFANGAETSYSLTTNMGVPPPAPPSSVLSVGNIQTVLNSGLDGGLGELIGYNSVLSPANIARVYNYGKAKWGTP